MAAVERGESEAADDRKTRLAAPGVDEAEADAIFERMTRGWDAEHARGVTLVQPDDDKLFAAALAEPSSAKPESSSGIGARVMRLTMLVGEASLTQHASSVQLPRSLPNASTRARGAAR